MQTTNMIKCVGMAKSYGTNGVFFSSSSLNHSLFQKLSNYPFKIITISIKKSRLLSLYHIGLHGKALRLKPTVNSSIYPTYTVSLKLDACICPIQLSSVYIHLCFLCRAWQPSVPDKTLQSSRLLDKRKTLKLSKHEKTLSVCCKFCLYVRLLTF